VRFYLSVYLGFDWLNHKFFSWFQVLEHPAYLYHYFFKVAIKSKNRTEVNISLKKQNFSFWSSASKYSAAKNILDYLVKSNIISVSNAGGRGVITNLSTGKPLVGIKTKATIGEIKKYCFGDGENKVDYILIQSFDAGDFRDIRKTGGGQD